MKYMFYYATNFNQQLNDWNVASVTDMYGMFEEAFNFNQLLNDWNVASVNDMHGMFLDATKFNQPLNDWDVMTSVTDIEGMFDNAFDFNHQCLSSWAGNFMSDLNVRKISLSGMLYRTSSCPNTEPVAKVAPWCHVRVKMSNPWRLAMHQALRPPQHQALSQPQHQALLQPKFQALHQPLVCRPKLQSIALNVLSNAWRLAMHQTC